jgi:N utilization substance protein B
MGTRRKARESALKMLYAWEVNRLPPALVVEQFWKYYEPEQEGREFADRLFIGTAEHLEELDRLIQQASIHWKLNRMAAVDRNLLRLAAYELFYLDDVPKRVTLNEAIEIARRYGTDDSWAFINGVLDNLAQTVKD